jgi:hypothetical protein
MGSILEMYGFEGSAEGLVSTYTAKMFHPEGPGNYAVRQGTLIRVDYSATAQFVGDGTKPGPSVGMSQQSTRFRFVLSRQATYIHHQPEQAPTLSPKPNPRGMHVAIDGEPGWDKLIRGQWVEYNSFPLAIS